jgi:hypothetical protein
MKSLYDYFNNLYLKYNPKEYHLDYIQKEPVPYLVIDDFLPKDILTQAQSEIAQIPDYQWTNFTRKGSLMRECKIFSSAPTIQTLTHCFNSGVFLNWLEALTGKDRIISDPKLVGAGLSTCSNGHFLNLHTDFNWNEQLHLNRSCSAILYLNPKWDEQWNGALEFWDFERTECLVKTYPIPNRLIIWDYDERLIHGYPTPLACPTDQQRENLRLFYYSSNSTPISNPHRSLYWWDEQTKMPFDNRNER